jgi:hypothetical protein
MAILLFVDMVILLFAAASGPLDPLIGVTSDADDPYLREGPDWRGAKSHSPLGEGAGWPSVRP